MIAKGTKITSFVEVFFEDTTQKPLALTYTIVGYGQFIRREGLWVVWDRIDEEVFDGAEFITIEKEDAKELKLQEKFDKGEDVSRDEIFKYRTDKYEDV